MALTVSVVLHLLGCVGSAGMDRAPGDRPAGDSGSARTDGGVLVPGDAGVVQTPDAGASDAGSSDATTLTDSGPGPTPAGQYFVGDFSAAADDTELHAMVNVTTTGNVHADPGIGMRYDFQAFPMRCGDQALSSVVPLPAGTREAWVRFRIRFSSNWTNDNPNCGSSSPDYKTLLIFQRSARYELKVGSLGRFLTGAVPGFPALDTVPISVVQPGRGSAAPLLANDLWDGSWHVVEMHVLSESATRGMIQIRIDGILTHNYSTETVGVEDLIRINIGANRNLGATELMHIWWDDFETWVGGTDPGFAFPSPAVY